MKKTFRALCFTIILIFTFTCVSYGAKPTYYIAGNPSNAPFEYYDESDNCYKGILPDIYKLVEKQLDIKLVYLYPGPSNRQQELARNRQVEIISCYEQGTMENVDKEEVLLSYVRHGTHGNVTLGFTNDIPEYITQAITIYAENRDFTDIKAIKESEEEIRILQIMFLIFTALSLCLFFYVVSLRRKRKDLWYKVYLDSLTKLGNHNYYYAKFADFMSENSGIFTYAAFVDVNLTLLSYYVSEEEKNQYIIHTGKILNKEFRDSGFVTRVHDSGFVVLFRAASHSNAEKKTSEIIKKINRETEEAPVVLRAGIYHAQQGDSATDVITNAFRLYVYAEEHNEICFMATDTIVDTMTKKIHLQRDLLNALSGEDFRTYIKYVVNPESGVVCAASLTLRWHHPEHGILKPSEYITEDTDPAILYEHNIKKIARTAAVLERWKGTDKQNLYLICRISFETILNPAFISFISSIDQISLFDHKKLILSLAERNFGDNTDLVFQKSAELRSMGYSISFNSMFPAKTDFVTLDKKTMQSSLSGENKTLLTEYVKFCHSTDNKVICEGVNSASLAELAREANCDYALGSFYSPVLPEDTAENIKLKFI